jgi:hypothetical protein
VGRALKIQLAGLATLAALLFASGCGGSKSADSDSKQRFAASADRICGDHLQSVIGLLSDEPPLLTAQQAASRSESTYQIINVTIGRLEALGDPPNPHGRDFREYLKTLRARAALYRLTEEAELHRDVATATRMQKRISQIDTVGDGAARRYGLRVCGISTVDAARALDLGK